MVDTISFKYYFEDANDGLAKFLMNESNNTIFEFSKRVDGSHLQRMPLSQYVRYIRYGDTSKEVPMKMRSKKRVRSSHYFILYSVFYEKTPPYIWFNVSIPKYLYGNNVAQYIINPQNHKYKSYLHYQLDEQAKLLPRRLKNFIKLFFREQFPQFYVDLTKVVLSRIDLCYNQYFKNKDTALDYLNMQQDFNRKYQRKDKIAVPYKTGIFYHTQGYSAKIYHKGSEFAKHDRKEIVKWNDYIRKQITTAESSGNDKLVKHLRTELIDVDFIQKQADKILRYEIAFKNKQLSYIFNRKVFRKDCDKWKKYFDESNYEETIYKRLIEKENNYNLMIKNDVFKKDLKDKIKENIKQSYWEKHLNSVGDLRGVFNSVDKNELKWIRSVLDKTRLFYIFPNRRTLYNSYKTPLHSASTGSTGFLYEPAPFCGRYFYSFDEKANMTTGEITSKLTEVDAGITKHDNMFKELYKHFKDFIEYYQVKELPTKDKVLIKIKQYNDNARIKKEIHGSKGMTYEEKNKYGLTEKSYTKLLMLTELLQSHTLDELKNMGIFSERSYYRYKADLKRIAGIDHSYHHTNSAKMINPKIDYSEYFMNIRDTTKLFGNSNEIVSMY